jgi:hypothetical protein
MSLEIQKSFRETCLKGLIACGKVLQKKMPLDNPFLQAAGGLNPKQVGSVALQKCLKLVTCLPNDVLAVAAPSQSGEKSGRHETVSEAAPSQSGEKSGGDETVSEVDSEPDCSEAEAKETLQAAYSKELRTFFGRDIPAMEDQRVDEWWAEMFKRYQLPLLSRVVKAVLSTFHGPVVEGTFNIMGDVIDDRSGRMKMETFDAIQTTRYALMASGQTSSTLFHRNQVMRDPINRRLVNNMTTARQAYHTVLTEQTDGQQYDHSMPGISHSADRTDRRSTI